TQHIAEDMTSILEFLSRVMQAVEEGNANYLHDKAGQLARAARRLQADVSKHPLPEDPNEHPARDRTKRFDPARVQRLIEQSASHYRAGRALYPQPVTANILGGGR